MLVNGDREWYQNGNLHRDGDKPAIIESKNKWWYQNGKRHRDNGKPAVMLVNGDREWWENGLRHRDGDKPAILYKDGTEKYYKAGKRYIPKHIQKKINKKRLDRAKTNVEVKKNRLLEDLNETRVPLQNGGYKLVYSDGVYYRDKNDEVHRDGDEPAVVDEYGKQWYKHGKRHRDDDKPAIIDQWGEETYYKNGKKYTPEVKVKERLSRAKKNVEVKKNRLLEDLNEETVFDLGGGKVKVIEGHRTTYYKNYKKHREDGPAVVNKWGEYWYQNDKKHRDDGPAVIMPNGDKEWYQHGKRHRDDDKPAVVLADGTKLYYMNGEKYTPVDAKQRLTRAKKNVEVKKNRLLESKEPRVELGNGNYKLVFINRTIYYNSKDQKHRDGDEPAYITDTGGKEWWKNDELHRDGDLPAIINRFGRVWYKNGKRHRDDDKPAIIRNDGVKEWWKNDEKYTPKHIIKKTNQERLGRAKKNVEVKKNRLLEDLNEDYKRTELGNNRYMIELPSGGKTWFKKMDVGDDLVHRDGDEPAMIFQDARTWYKNGLRHRDGDKPAFIDDEGVAYWKNGEEYTPKHIQKKINQERTDRAKKNVEVKKNRLLEDLNEERTDLGDGNYKIKYHSRVEYYDSKGLKHRGDDKPAVIWNGGDKEWWKHGQKHRDGDKPSAYENGIRWWYKNDKKHREGGKPAIIYADGYKLYFLNGKQYVPKHVLRKKNKKRLDRVRKNVEVKKNRLLEDLNEDKKTELGNGRYMIEYDDGIKEWYKNGRLHRGGDLPAVIYARGIKMWYKNGRLHRGGDLPAIVTKKGTKQWYKNGLRHRGGDKPAFIDYNGREIYYKNGKKYTPKPNLKKINQERIDRAKTNVEVKKNRLLEGLLYGSAKEKRTELSNGDYKIEFDGGTWWFNKNNEIHRDRDLPAIVDKDSKQWLQHNKRHRDGDKPAVISKNGDKAWYQNGKAHREGDLPAIISKNGKYWIKNDKLHRDGDKPAIIKANGEEIYYKNDKKYTPKNLQKKTNKKRIDRAKKNVETKKNRLLEDLQKTNY